MAVHTVIGVILVVWTALAGRSAAQQQQPAALPSATADEMFIIIARAVQQELRPVIRRFESRVESLDNRLTLLDSRVTELTTSILRSRQSEQMEELSTQLTSITARLDSQQSQLSQLNTQLNEQKSHQEETATTVNNVTAQLDSIVTQQGDQRLTQTSQLATRIDSQQSQLSELNNQLNERRTTHGEVSVRMDDLTSKVDLLGSKLTGAINNTSSQQERIDDLAAKVKQLAPARDCSDLPVDSPSGVYLLRPSGSSTQPPIEAYCDMATAGGNWTVIQRRDDIKPHQDFYLGWTYYKEGFGNVTKEFWWGLEHVYQLTSSGRQFELRIDLEAFDGNRSYATYQQFRISSEVDGYRLSYTNYSGTAGDGLRPSVNAKFSTRDRDQDSYGYNCVQLREGPWWWGTGWGCEDSSLNGRYRDGGNRDATGIWWYEWRTYESLKKVDMKIRPT
ncbi:techylectin-5A-like [Amphibalanus amphitrite]|uniref:techylectin-5A-like n=1 Tax=Amphibalanus amphitrite TaxID=1232801 RepID=UPI001C90199C|nr:techylectin-5A-like [Amphibalanus amphitrite]